MAQAQKLDFEIETKPREIGGESYAFLCNMSFRIAFATHKLITNENGETKENASGGCIGTVDVSYPSVPLFLMYNTESGLFENFIARSVQGGIFMPMMRFSQK